MRTIGDLTQQKGYEVIKKYNQLSSYLKNVINLKALSDTDQKAIEKQFDDLKEKLMLLKQIASQTILERYTVNCLINSISFNPLIQTTVPKRRLQLSLTQRCSIRR